MRHANWQALRLDGWLIAVLRDEQMPISEWPKFVVEAMAVLSYPYWEEGGDEPVRAFVESLVTDETWLRSMPCSPLLVVSL